MKSRYGVGIEVRRYFMDFFGYFRPVITVVDQIFFPAAYPGYSAGTGQHIPRFAELTILVSHIVNGYRKSAVVYRNDVGFSTSDGYSASIRWTTDFFCPVVPAYKVRKNRLSPCPSIAGIIALNRCPVKSVSGDLPKISSMDLLQLRKRASVTTSFSYKGSRSINRRGPASKKLL